MELELEKITNNNRPARKKILDDPSLLKIKGDLNQLESCWKRRGKAFYTLGAATYLDACGSGSYENYSQIMTEFNKILSSNFGDLLETVKKSLTELTGNKCEFHDKLALPGFHIFLGESLSSNFRDHLHLDLQFMYLPIDVDYYTPSLTYTLPIELPEGGAGIEFCYKQNDKDKGIIEIERYNGGELLLHSGRTLHRRAYYPPTVACRRITLQGHAVLINNIWNLYW